MGRGDQSQTDAELLIAPRPVAAGDSDQSVIRWPLTPPALLAEAVSSPERFYQSVEAALGGLLVDETDSLRELPVLSRAAQRLSSEKASVIEYAVFYRRDAFILALTIRDRERLGKMFDGESRWMSLISSTSAEKIIQTRDQIAGALRRGGAVSGAPDSRGAAESLERRRSSEKWKGRRAAGFSQPAG